MNLFSSNPIFCFISVFIPINIEKNPFNKVEGVSELIKVKPVLELFDPGIVF